MSNIDGQNKDQYSLQQNPNGQQIQPSHNQNGQQIQHPQQFQHSPNGQPHHNPNFQFGANPNHRPQKQQVDFGFAFNILGWVIGSLAAAFAIIMTVTFFAGAFAPLPTNHWGEPIEGGRLLLMTAGGAAIAGIFATGLVAFVPLLIFILLKADSRFVKIFVFFVTIFCLGLLVVVGATMGIVYASQINYLLGI
ncbi:MAG: hypothetical protein FWD86_02610 [Firmicutes bacterium]|nr:hypothetical protein [Bacillota bacterium]